MRERTGWRGGKEGRKKGAFKEEKTTEKKESGNHRRSRMKKRDQTEEKRKRGRKEKATPNTLRVRMQQILALIVAARGQLYMSASSPKLSPYE